MAAFLPALMCAWTARGTRLAGRLCLLAAVTAAAAGANDDKPVDYLTQVRPLLESRCYECHGAETREAGLRLDRREPALAGGDSGAVIAPGKPEESLLIELISGVDPDRVMPPTGETLADDEIELLKRWIAAGAPWPSDADGPAERSAHWSYQPLRRSIPPDVENGVLVRNPIDSFVQAELAREGFAPAPEADRYTLIKRLYYDLLGLPPTPDAVDAFVHDQSPDAYESLVAELLDSPHFGERWGRHWLDKARYADSDGYEKDRPRYHAWKYRDWVIQAVNSDVPFDRFTIEQLAGDLLESPSSEQLVATGFNRQTLTNTEGGVDQEEFRVEAVFDRVETVGAVWLGLTVGCARCHSHKYDQISQREYYQLFAFFNNGDEASLPLPTSPEAFADYEAESGKWKAKLAELEQPLADRRRELEPAFADWAEQMAERVRVVRESPQLAVTPEVTTREGTELERREDGSYLAAGPRPEQDVYELRFRLPAEGESAKDDSLAGLVLEVLTDPSLPQQGPGRSDNGNFVLSEITLDVADVGGDGTTRRLVLASASADFSQKGYEVAKAIDGAETSVGWAVAPQIGKPHRATFRLKEPLRRSSKEQTVTVRLSQQYSQFGQTPHLLGRFRLRMLSAHELEIAALPEEVRTALTVEAANRSEKQRQTLFDHFSSTDREYKRLHAAVEKHRKAAPFRPEFPVAILRERTEDRRATRVLRRGSFLEPLGIVHPGLLEVVPHPPQPQGRELTRLDLANWLVSPDNPLTSRVVVNSFWAHLFGQGLVKTVNDYGVRGEEPSHPRLLDWLAAEFQRVGWSRKALLKTILLSHTYRQSSVHRPELVERDPENRLLARQNRFRVEGEIVRDLYLAASGLLEPRIGGPSVFPPLPPGIAELSYANNFKWGDSDWNTRPDNPHGVPPRDDVHRRGMYTFFKRTAAHPNLMTFDCPDANTTCVLRSTSNTPLQALQTLNNDAFVETSRALARRVRLATADDESRIALMFRLCVARPPHVGEASALASLLADTRTHYFEDDAAAAALCGAQPTDEASAGEAAAWITLARIVMNLDEFLTRE